MTLSDEIVSVNMWISFIYFVSLLQVKLEDDPKREL